MFGSIIFQVDTEHLVTMAGKVRCINRRIHDIYRISARIYVVLNPCSVPFHGPLLATIDIDHVEISLIRPFGRVGESDAIRGQAGPGHKEVHLVAVIRYPAEINRVTEISFKIRTIPICPHGCNNQAGAEEDKEKYTRQMEREGIRPVHFYH